MSDRPPPQLPPEVCTQCHGAGEFPYPSGALVWGSDLKAEPRITETPNGHTIWNPRPKDDEIDDDDIWMLGPVQGYVTIPYWWRVAPTE